MCERFFFIFIPDKNRQKQFILQLFLLIVISGRYIYYYFWSKNVWCTKTISNTHTLKQFLGSVVSCNFGNCFYSIHPSYIRVELKYLYPLSYSVCLILPHTRGGICNMKYQVICNKRLHTYMLKTYKVQRFSLPPLKWITMHYTIGHIYYQISLYFVVLQVLCLWTMNVLDKFGSLRGCAFDRFYEHF